MLRNIIQFSTKLRGLNVIKVTSASTYIQVQNYSRFTSRKHAKIVNEDELFDEPDASYPEERQPLEPEPSSRRRKRKPTRRQKAALRHLDVEEDAALEGFQKTKRKPKVEDVPPKTKTMFTKLYENEKELSSLMIQIKSKKQRKKLNKILLEGSRLITDALQAGLIPEKIIFSRNDDLKKLPLSECTNKYKVPYRTIQLWSSLTTPSGLMGIFETPNVEKFLTHDSLPITILCDNIRDPGNMGSILRAAAGVGCEKIILTKGCVDLWEPKVLRSAAGAHFRLPIYSEKNWYEIRSMLSQGSKFVVADNQVDDTFSNESIGSENTEEVEILDNDNDNEENVSNKHGVENTRTDLSKELSVVPYYSIDYTQGETVIIVGGETEGLSESSFRIASNNDGVRVNVPLNNGVESLNSGMAVGIIAFEIKRQFLMAVKKE